MLVFFFVWIFGGNITCIYTSRTYSGMPCHGRRICPVPAEVLGLNIRPRLYTFSSHCPVVSRLDTHRTLIPLCLCTGANTRPSRRDTRPRHRKCARYRLVRCPACRGTNTCIRPKCWSTYLGTAHVRCATSIRRCLRNEQIKIFIKSKSKTFYNRLLWY